MQISFVTSPVRQFMKALMPRTSVMVLIVVAACTSASKDNAAGRVESAKPHSAAGSARLDAQHDGGVVASPDASISMVPTTINRSGNWVKCICAPRNH